MSLSLIAIGASAMSLIPFFGIYSDAALLQTSVFDLGGMHGRGLESLPILVRYAAYIRAGSIFAIVIGIGSLVIPWINAVVYRSSRSD
ncbi:MAG TPA: hypothetical protein VM452_19885 [Caulifigura sp.]|nr:hypothetical protein [Caulifigura sp.]